MGSISGLLGTAGGVGGTGISSAANGNVQQGVTTDQTAAANTGVTNALGGSQGLLNALQSGSGVGTNQSLAAAQGQTALSQLNSGPGVNMQNTAATGTNALNKALGQVNGAGAQNDAIQGTSTLSGQLGQVNGAGAQGAALQGTGALANQLGSANGVGTQQAGIQGLQNTASQLQGVANGTGPNPAMAALNQQTGQNVANQAALMAGQRGASSNVGLMARQAAQQGAATQQQAVGQGATLQSQQQLNALGQMGAANQAVAGAGATLTGQQQSALAQQGSLGQGAVGQQQTALSQEGALGQGAVGQQQAGLNQQFTQGSQGVAQQQAQQGINAGIAQNQVANALGANGQVVQGNLGAQSNLLSGLGSQNSANVSSQTSVNAANAGEANTSMQGQQGLIGGLMNSASSMLHKGGEVYGGEIHQPKNMAGGGILGSVIKLAPLALAALASGGEVSEQQPEQRGGGKSSTSQQPFQMGMGANGAQSSFGNFMMGGSPGANALSNGMTNLINSLKQAPQGQQASADQVPMQSAQNGDPAPIDLTADMNPTGINSLKQAPQGQQASADQVPMQSAQNGDPPEMSQGGLADSGGHVAAKEPMQKAMKKGDSYDNDKVPTMLSEGEVVIPRSVMQSGDPAGGAAKFIAALIAKKGAK